MNPMKPLIINTNKFEYKNKDAAENLIRYITRKRPNETRAHELLSYGFNSGFAYLKPIEDVIREFEYVQNIYGAEGCLMCHYVIHISQQLYARMNNDLNRLNCYGTDCCSFLFNLGYQACYAIHYSESDRLHLHLAINRVNYRNGSKLRQYPAEIRDTIEKPLCDLIKTYIDPVIFNGTLDDM